LVDNVSTLTGFLHTDHKPVKVIVPVWPSLKNTFQAFGDFCTRTKMGNGHHRV